VDTDRRPAAVEPFRNLQCGLTAGEVVSHHNRRVYASILCAAPDKPCVGGEIRVVQVTVRIRPDVHTNMMPEGTGACQEYEEPYLVNKRLINA